jgi:hypothetical protein
MNKFCKYYFVLLGCIYLKVLNAQPFLPLQDNLIRETDAIIIKNNSSVSTFLKPYSFSCLNQQVKADSLISIFKDTPSKQKNWFVRKFYYEHLFNIDTNGFHLSLDPVFNFQGAIKTTGFNEYLVNTRGIRLCGDIGKISFVSEFYENQAFFPAYVDSFIKNSQVVPGQGFARSYNVTGFDFAYSTAELYYKATASFTCIFGLGKNFVGDGYRSMLFSDNSFNYPFLRFSYDGKKLHYSHIYAVLMDITNKWFPFGVNRKLAGFSILSYMPINWFELSAFEGNIWQYPYASNKTRFDMNYLNPMIFVNTLLKNDENNSLTGIGFKLNCDRAIQLYGQIAIDDINLRELLKNNGYKGNKYAFQAGAKYFDVFSLKNLFLQIEYNTARPYTYSYSPAALTYSNYNQALADPLGANFREGIFITQYRLNRFLVEYHFNYAKYGTNQSGKNDGNDIFDDMISGVPYYNNFTGQGLKNTLVYQNVELSYLMNPKTNMNIVIGFTKRKVLTENSNNLQSFYYIGFRTSLSNSYFDF